jgi:hypothetical protein
MRLISFRVCNKSNTTDATSGGETSHPSGRADVIPGFCGIPVAQYLVFCVVFVDQNLSVCPISFGHYIVCYFVIDLRLLVTSLVSSDVSH